MMMKTTEHIEKGCWLRLCSCVIHRSSRGRRSSLHESSMMVLMPVRRENYQDREDLVDCDDARHTDLADCRGSFFTVVYVLYRSV